MGVVREWVDRNITLDYKECLVWPFSRKSTSGPPQIRFRGRTIRTARFLCEGMYGAPPTPKHEAAHSCGRLWCVNHRHIRWATKAENEADKIIHGTILYGERNLQSKLTEASVREIRRLCKIKGTSELSRIFGVEKTTIYNVIRRRTWQQVA